MTLSHSGPQTALPHFFLKALLVSVVVTILENLFGSAFYKNSQNPEGQLLVERGLLSCL